MDRLAKCFLSGPGKSSTTTNLASVKELSEYTGDVSRLCVQHKVRKLYAFGSVLTDKFHAASDIDLIVDFEPIGYAQYADNYYSFKHSLEKVFHKPVDLLEEQAIRNPYFRQTVDKQRQLIYED